MNQISEANSKHRIEVSGVGKHFGDLEVFKDINLTFGEREIVTIVGPSG
jgi:ABC-type Fe3+/spermidine/putrescine transport system ATPase subunit